MRIVQIPQSDDHQKDDVVILEERKSQNLWNLAIEEVRGQSLEAKNRDEVNRMLSEGWILLHIYTLYYREDGIWRERPMGILGKPKS